jgi:hypothetical protein
MVRNAKRRPDVGQSAGQEPGVGLAVWVHSLRGGEIEFGIPGYQFERVLQFDHCAPALVFE